MDSARTSMVSLVMRTVGGRPREIRRALASVEANTFRPVEVVIVYQGSDEAEWAAIEALPGEFSSITITTLRNLGQGDRRAENLNIGWEAARGRYTGFLDDDDTLSAGHFSLLVPAIEASGRAWAYGQVTLRKEDGDLAIVSETRPFRRNRFRFADLWAENFVPIHSMLIDRDRLAPQLRVRPFCEELDRSEDWDFLIRLGFFHEPAVVEEFTCTYHVSTGDRNTNISLMANTAEDKQDQNRRAWARCKALVDQRKADLMSTVWWSGELLGHEAPAPAHASAPAAAAGLRRRIVRKLIRLLERML